MKSLMFFTILLALSCCSKQEKKFVIGVSQCSEDIWRHKLNDELRMGAYFHEGVELKMANADDNDQRQIAQIDSLVESGIDLLIVAPNQTTLLAPAIDRAYDKGIPVIVFDRKTDSKKFTAYIGADNEAMGRQMGEYIATELGGKGRVLEIMGLKGSSPAIERHRGFADALSHYPDIELVASLQGDWTEKSAVEAIRKYEGDLTDINYVFGQNDRMAVGARKVLLAASDGKPGTSPSIRFCGIDGLPGEGGGLECVRDSVLSASFIYPTHGDEVLQLAIDILENKPYEKENMLMSALVTPDNARVLLMLNEEIARRSTYLESLGVKADSYLQQLATQRTNFFLTIGVLVLIILVLVLFALYRRGKITLRRQRVVSTLWNMEEKVRPQETLSQPLSVSEENGQPSPDESTDSLPPQKEAGETSRGEEPLGKESPEYPLFISQFKEVVERRLDDSELSVEDLAADMNISRVQLYRKVKSLTGSSPVELLRTARLNRGYQLLLTTDKTISEVAYAVGFTAPSYFTKCFKDEFGVSPSEVHS